jgi:myosin heavy subunit
MEAKPVKPFNWKYATVTMFVVMVLAAGSLGYALSNTSSKLDNTRNTLTSTKSQLTLTQGQLSSTKDSLNTANTNLASTQLMLSQTQTTLANTQGQLTSTQNQLSSTQDQLKTSQSALTDAQSQVSSLQIQLSSTQSSLSSATMQVSSLQSQLAEKTLKYFTNQTALVGWLATQPMYTSADIYGSAVKLKNSAIDAGFIMDVYVVYMNGTNYGDDEVLCADGNVYIVSPVSHNVSLVYNDGPQSTP